MKLIKFSVMFFASAMFFASCNEAPKSDDAKTEDAKKVDDKKAEGAAELKLDTGVSEMSWVGTKKIGDKHNGTFKLTEGKISLKDGQITAGSFVVDIKSMKVLDLTDTTANKKLAGHLLSKDFFEADKFATATFEITNVAPFKKEEGEKKDDKKDAEYSIADPTHTVTGNLELKGVKKSIAFPAKITITGDKAEAEAKFNINRKDFGMAYGTEESLGDKMINNAVNIGLKLVANK
jgi:polyisoprenoid-binding protein YceI